MVRGRRLALELLVVLLGIAAFWLWLRKWDRLPPAAKPAPIASSPTTTEKPTHQAHHLTWGSEPGQVARTRPSEANPEGPMSLTTLGDDVWILDQVNRRLSRLGGAQTVALPLLAAQEVAAADGHLFVLDRLGDHAIAVFDTTGKQTAWVAMPPHLAPGAVSGMLVRGGKIYLEQGHETLHAIATVDGKALPASEPLPGRVSSDGGYVVRARIIDASLGRLAVSKVAVPVLQLAFARELMMGAPILFVLDADSDNAGLIYVAVLVRTGEQTNEARLICLSAEGDTLGTQVLPSYPMAEEMFRRFSVRREGGFVYAYADELGYHVLEGKCR